MSDYDNEPRPPRPEVVNETVVVVDGRKAMSGAWGLVLAVGIVAVIFGIIVLFNIWGSLRLVAILAGLFLVFAGIMQLVTAARAQRKGGGVIASGVITLILGLVLVFWPEASLKTVAVASWASVSSSGASPWWSRPWWGTAARVPAWPPASAYCSPSSASWSWSGRVRRSPSSWRWSGLSAIVFGISAIAQGLAMRKA